MHLRFTKMQGQGNDFVMLNGITQSFSLSPSQLQKLADRHFGIGCDQVLVVEAATQPGVDFRYRIYNADGGEVEQCGNGARCFARFVRDEGLTTQPVIRVETMSGIIAPKLEEDGRVTVDMGPPRLLPAEIPFIADQPALKYPIHVQGQQVMVGVVSMGNPHAVQLVDHIDTAPVGEMGPLIEHHEQFPRRVNAGFMQVVSPEHIRLRVWERGAGETLACGTGACAAVVLGIRWGLLKDVVRVSTRGGDLVVSWQGTEKAAVMMSGAAMVVYRGEIEI